MRGPGPGSGGRGQHEPGFAFDGRLYQRDNSAGCPGDLPATCAIESPFSRKTGCCPTITTPVRPSGSSGDSTASDAIVSACARETTSITIRWGASGCPSFTDRMVSALQGGFGRQQLYLCGEIPFRRHKLPGLQMASKHRQKVLQLLILGEADDVARRKDLRGGGEPRGRDSLAGHTELQIVHDKRNDACKINHA